VYKRQIIDHSGYAYDSCSRIEGLKFRQSGVPLQTPLTF
jgi:hypothetical protein